MPDIVLPDEARRATEFLNRADIVIGIPSYNNARTIGHVVRAAYAGLAKYFPQWNGVVINSDGGSTDGTRDAVLSARVEDSHLMLLTTPVVAAHRLSFPYHGIPGKGSAFRLIFQLARNLGAKACCVVDSDLRSITPEWIDLLIRPIMFAGYDFVAPYYHRHKYDGTITNSIVYPLTRALYGLRVRQPIGGEFGISARLIERYLKRDDWETDVARYGIDIWMTTIAIAEGFRVCQSFLGAKLHDAKDPGSDLSAMLQQVVGSVFLLMQEYENVWQQKESTEPAELFGFRFDVGLDPRQRGTHDSDVRPLRRRVARGLGDGVAPGDNARRRGTGPAGGLAAWSLPHGRRFVGAHRARFRLRLQAQSGVARRDREIAHGALFGARGFVRDRN
jgi:glucosylglycerate synthase